MGGSNDLVEVGSRVNVWSDSTLCGEFLVTRRVAEGSQTRYFGRKLFVDKDGRETWEGGHQWSTNGYTKFTWSQIAPPPPQPACLRCGSPSVIKTNRTTKKQFTGCSSWPRCTWSEDYNGVSMSASKNVGSKIKFQTNSGPIVGVVVGTNNNNNLIVRVDKKSPVKGFKLSSDMLYTVEDYVDDKYSKGLKNYTFWHLSKNDEVEEASDSDLLQDPEPSLKEKFSAKATEEKSAQKETVMSEKKTAFQIAKSDGHEAAYRVAGKRISAGGKALLTKAIKGSLSPEHGATVEAIMDTPIGTALTQLAMGWGLTYVPGMGQDPRLQKLATEFRVQGTAEGMDMVAGVVLDQLQPILNDALSMLPGGETTEKARIATPSEAPAAKLEEEGEVLELSDVPVEGKKAAAGK